MNQTPDHARRQVRRRGQDHVMAIRMESIVRTMIEMEQGRRPMSALDPISSPLAARRIRSMIAELRRGRRTGPARGDHSRLVASSCSRPSIGASEGTVIVTSGERTHAYTVRLEQEGDRWRLVELASPDSPLSAAVTRASLEGGLPSDPNGIRRSSGSNGPAFSAPTMPGDPTFMIDPEDPAYQGPDADREDAGEDGGEDAPQGAATDDDGREDGEDGEDLD